MRLTHLTRLGIAMLAAMLVLVVMIPIALEPTQSVARVSRAVAGTHAVGSRSFDEDFVAVLVSEAIVLLVSAVGCGLIIAGVEALDIWSERRKNAARLRSPVGKPPRRETLPGYLAVTEKPLVLPEVTVHQEVPHASILFVCPRSLADRVNRLAERGYRGHHCNDGPLGGPPGAVR